MRDGCILGVGKGNEDWNNSAPHGAGRILSRGAAKRTLSIEDFQETMKGIYSTSISEATLDEAPFAYKPSEEIIELVKDTVEIETIIKPIYNFKAS
jgi:RNA-splicing ligase RtcB